jgi:hypothetical protein
MSAEQIQLVKGILVFYHHPLRQGASTIMDHVNAFKKYSDFNVWTVNTELGFPEGLKRVQFKALVLHYSLFVPPCYCLDENFLNYLDRCPDTYKVAFFQDEYRFCQQRFAFINRFKIDCVYTLLEPRYFNHVYQKYTKIEKLIYTLAGYVSDDLIDVAQKMTKAEDRREIDVGYRARQLSFYMGAGAQEKHEIGIRFRERANALGLKTDIETDERRRIYGRKWYEFLANCRAVLGVEAGVSIFDLQDRVRIECERLISESPGISFNEVSKKVLQPWEGNVPYRTVSPRHFEAAAFRVCQILFEGDYSGVMQPMVHYIPLKKDFSNFGDVTRMFKDRKLRSEIVENAYRDIIASGRYSYRKFIEESFDPSVPNSQPNSRIAGDEVWDVTALLQKGALRRKLYAVCGAIPYLPFPGRSLLTSVARRIGRRPCR